jgi:FtsP/CotA-like multicopper oxidase with cupredoxin domain
MVALSVTLAASATPVAAARPALCSVPAPTTHQGPITNADRLAAAQRAAAARAACTVALGPTATPSIANGLATPDYFGTSPNYANSPLPTDGAVVGFSGGGGTGATATATTVGGVVTAVTVTGGGTGYTSPPAISFLGGTGAGATATATLTGSVGSISVTTSGSGYTSAPAVVISGDGSGATAIAALSGEVTAVAPASPGSGYTSVPTIVFSGGGGGIGAAATATAGLGAVAVTGGTGYVDPVVGITPSGPGSGAAATATVGVNAITVGAGGTGYVTPVVTLVGGGATTAATATATLGAGGSISGITITDPGSGYTSAPTVDITDSTAPGGSGANATATVAILVTVTAPGAGYTSPPSIAITDNGGPGTGATATATLSVTGFTLTAPGIGYTSAPAVATSGGGGTGATGTATVKADSVFAVSVTNGGTNYTTASVSFTGGGGTLAAATASLSGAVGSVHLDSGGAGYVSGGIRKFVDSLPGLGSTNANDLGQYISIAVPDQTTYPGSDYYEIGLVQYRKQLSSDLSPTLLRGYVQLETSVMNVSAGSRHIALSNANLDGSSTPIFNGPNRVYAFDTPQYLGTTIIAQKDRPVRVKFTNLLPTGSGGNLFIPLDTTVMGAGAGPLDASGNPCDPATSTTCAVYSQNRATLHLHGGVTPWISDGTPNQWITPAGESTKYPKGVSVVNVPDMPDPGPGSETFFYTNQQSARLMFYHDHAYGITRLDVYAGEAAGYLVQDPTEAALVASGVIPSDEIPLIIQDKTFVPGSAQLAVEDPTWNTSKYGSTGNLWFPHVYIPNQNPSDSMGVNAMGRWDYGPWFWPPYTGIMTGAVANPLYGSTPDEGPTIPGIPNPSIVPEGFMDTPLVNGTTYPYLTVGQKAYRFQILNASNDRTWNLQLYCAASNGQMWDSGGHLVNPGAGEVAMVPAVQGLPGTSGYSTDITDGRAGGVPDVRTGGPAMIQIGTEGGLLPNPVTLPASPVGYEYNRRSITVTNVSDKNLMLGPAERADVIIDFSQVDLSKCSNLILYNDSPAPVPAFDPRYDYYTGDPDQTSTGGAPTTAAGYGPNTRTIMQFRVDPAKGIAPVFNAAALTTAIPAAFAESQDPIIVPESAYNAAYGTTAQDNYVRIQDTTATFAPYSTTTPFTPQTGSPVTIALQPKAIQELFEPMYGRMNATLGVELPNTTMINQTTIPLGYAEPYTEAISAGDVATPLGTTGDSTQLWKITHNGVDTHFIHFHLFNVQVINRVGWDGMVKPPDPNELGWKETVRMNPLEDTIVALRPIAPKVPFGLPDSIRSIDVTRPTTATISSFDITTGNAITVPNTPVNYGWEYVWHCHILGHEENDMMRPVKFDVPRAPAQAPVLSVASSAAGLNLSWTDGTPPTIPYGQAGTSWGASSGEIGYRIDRALVSGSVGPYSQIGTALANQTSFVDTTAVPATTYRYRVTAFNAAGDSVSSAFQQSLTATPPGPPLAVNAVAGNGSATVSWSAPTADGQSPPITGYTVTSSPGGVHCTTTGGLTCPVSPLANGTAYTFTVTADNAIGTGPASAASNVVFPGTAPAPPATVTAEAAPGAAAVTWTAPTNPTIPVTAYTVTSSPAGGSCAPTIALGCKVTGLTDGVAYTFTVRAANLWGTSAGTTSNSVIPVDVPSPPTGVVAIAGDGQASVTWVAPVNTGSLPITGYAVTSSPDGSTCTTAGSIGCAVTGLTDGTAYTFTVRAINSYGTSARSGPSTAVTPAGVPGAPVSVVALAGETSASVAWAAPASNGSAITGYTVTSSPDSQHCATSGATTCTVSGLTKGTTYTFTVTATNGVGTGPASAPSVSVTFHAGATYIPIAPTRILDTRNGTGGSWAPLSSHVARTFQVTGSAVPANATAVTGNLTVTGQTRNGYFFIGPVAMDNPTSSTLNFPVGDDRANAVTVSLGLGGTLSVTYVGAAAGATAQVVFDVTGYFVPDSSGATYHPVNPARVLDTRDGTGGSWAPLSSHGARTFQVTGGLSGIPSNATAVTGNLTVTQQSRNGYLYIGPVAANDPTSSTLNFPLGDNRANSVTVALGEGINSPLGSLSATYVGSGPGTAHVIFDVTGYFTPDMTGATYVPLNPTRILDTRSGAGLSNPFSSHVARPFGVVGAGVAPANATAVTGNLTVTGQTSPGYLFIGPVAMNNPTSSTLNFPVGDDRANGATVALGAGSLSVTFVGASPSATAQVIFDVTGYFTR